MTKVIISLAIFCFFLSCDKEETRYLYNQYDSEYDIFLSAAKDQCVNESQFFTTYDTYAEFDSAPYALDEIFKISIEDGANNITLYAKITAINATDIQVTFDSSNTQYQKVVTWEESDHTSLGEFLKHAVCNQKYSEYFSGISGKDSTTNLNYKWFKETILDTNDSGDTVAYQRVNDTLSVNLRYPTFLYFYNGTKELKVVAEEGNEENTETLKYTIELMDSEDLECYGSSSEIKDGCDFENTGTFPSCTVSIDEDAYKLRPYETKVISLGGTGCKLYDF